MLVIGIVTKRKKNLYHHLLFLHMHANTHTHDTKENWFKRFFLFLRRYFSVSLFFFVVIASILEVNFMIRLLLLLLFELNMICMRAFIFFSPFQTHTWPKKRMLHKRKCKSRHVAHDFLHNSLLFDLVTYVYLTWIVMLYMEKLRNIWLGKVFP